MSFDQCVMWFRLLISYVLYGFQWWFNQRWFVVSNGFLFVLGVVLALFFSVIYPSGVSIDD